MLTDSSSHSLVPAADEQSVAPPESKPLVSVSNFLLSSFHGSEFDDTKLGAAVTQAVTGGPAHHHHSGSFYDSDFLQGCLGDVVGDDEDLLGAADLEASAFY